MANVHLFVSPEHFSFFFSFVLQFKMNEKGLIIKIRSPSLEETLPIRVDTDATISSLKQAIQLSHPQQPACSDQRIIYSGRLLEDTEIIDTILNKV